MRETHREEYYKGYRFRTGDWTWNKSMFGNTHHFDPNQKMRGGGKGDHKGKRFGKLVVIECLARNRSAGSYWWGCECDCGTRFAALSRNLIRGATKSCGCLRGT